MWLDYGKCKNWQRKDISNTMLWNIALFWYIFSFVQFLIKISVYLLLLSAITSSSQATASSRHSEGSRASLMPRSSSGRWWRRPSRLNRTHRITELNTTCNKSVWAWGRSGYLNCHLKFTTDRSSLQDSKLFLTHASLRQNKRGDETDSLL